jgi:copper chaperone
MSCEHCVKTIRTVVGALPGVADVSVDLSLNTVTVIHDPAQCPLDKIRLEIEGQGYDIVA